MKLAFFPILAMMLGTPVVHATIIDITSNFSVANGNVQLASNLATLTVTNENSAVITGNVSGIYSFEYSLTGNFIDSYFVSGSNHDMNPLLPTEAFVTYTFNTPYTGYLAFQVQALDDAGAGVLQIRNISDAPILAAVPEPETYAMLLAGMGLVGAVARRRQKTGIPKARLAA